MTYIAVTIIVTTIVAEAHTLNGSHWSSSPVGYYDITTNYSGNVTSRRWDFNGAVSDMQIQDSGTPDEVQISDSAYGSTGWDGLCSWSTIWQPTMYVDLNDSYMLGYAGNKRSAVIAHEFGHCMGGLDHHNSTGRIMQSCSCDYYDDDGVWGIDSGSAAEINSLW